MLRSPGAESLLNTILVKMTFIFLIVTVPLVLLLNWINVLGMNVVRNQVSLSNANLISLYMEQVDRDLSEVDKYLYNVAALDSDVTAMEVSEKSDSKRYWLAKIRLSNQFGADIANYGTIDTLFVYSGVNRDLLSVSSSALGATASEAVSDAIVALLTSESPTGRFENDRWYVHELGRARVLFHAVRSGGVIIGAWTEIGKLVVPLSLIDLGTDGKAFLVSSTGEALNNEEFARGEGLNFALGSAPFAITGTGDRYLVVGKPSRRGDFGLAAAVPEKVILERLPFAHKLVSAWIPLILVLVAVAYLLFLRKVILLPVHTIVIAMRSIKNGDLSARIAKAKTSNEFMLMDETFNQMASEINVLKIRVYEEQLQKQRAELGHLQLQVKPHFFLNTLNVIYQLAQVKDYALIQEMSLRLVEFFRFKIRAGTPVVPLREELDHTRAYLDIQKLRFPDYLRYEVHAPAHLLEVPVPPMIVQTFAENSVKYAMTLDEATDIVVGARIEKENGSSFAAISISDNGKGFPPSLLDMGEPDEGPEAEPEEHIGIWNARHRLSLIYGGNARIVFSNPVSGGALVELRIPLSADLIVGRESGAADA